MDREKVIKGLEHCIASSDCRGCLYFKQIEEDGGLCALRSDALALLKEQEAVVRCKCGWRYCPSCGQVVKWG